MSVYPDVIWWDQNWRKGGLSERRLAIIREYGFYNQQYCGCEFSMRASQVDRNRILLVGGESFYFDPLFFLFFASGGRAQLVQVILMALCVSKK